MLPADEASPARQLPEGMLVDCEVSGYDPRRCLFGDPVGVQALADWLDRYAR